MVSFSNFVGSSPVLGDWNIIANVIGKPISQGMALLWGQWHPGAIWGVSALGDVRVVYWLLRKTPSCLGSHYQSMTGFFLAQYRIRYL